MRTKAPIISTAVAMASGLGLLFYYFFPTPANQVIRSMLLQWATTLAAVALFVGAMNLLVVHFNKVGAGGGNSVYSIILIVSMLGTLLFVLVFGPNHIGSKLIFEAVIVPVETSLMAVLAISLAYASARLLQRRPTVLSVIFVVTVLLVLLGTGPYLTSMFPFARGLRDWIAQFPAAAGARGILLGVALGTIATGLRILMGTDRPYGG